MTYNIGTFNCTFSFTSCDNFEKFIKMKQVTSEPPRMKGKQTSRHEDKRERYDNEDSKCLYLRSHHHHDELDQVHQHI